MLRFSSGNGTASVPLDDLDVAGSNAMVPQREKPPAPAPIKEEEEEDPLVIPESQEEPSSQPYHLDEEADDQAPQKPHVHAHVRVRY